MTLSVLRPLQSLFGVGRWAAVALLASAAVLVTAPAADAASTVSAQVSAVQVTPGGLSFILSTRGLPAGATLDPAGVSVAADGTSLSAGAAPMDGGGSAARPTRVVFMLLDSSGSMAGARIAAAEAAASAYAKSLPSDVKVGLIDFAEKPHLLLTPTSDDSAFTTSLAKVQAGGGTALYDALQTALHAFSAAGYDATADRRLLVLSDGDDTQSATTLDRLTAALASARIPADVVALTDTAPSPVLARIAAASGGQVIRAGNTAGLAAAFQLSARTVQQELLVRATVPAALAGHAATLTVHLTAGTRHLTATTSVVFAAAPAAGSASTPGRRPAVSSVASASGPLAVLGNNLWLVLGLCFLAVFLAVAAGLSPASSRSRRLGQLDAYVQRPVGTPGVQGATRPGGPFGGADSAIARTALSMADRAVKSRGGLEERLAADLDRAGMTWTASQWTLVRAGAAVAAAALLALLTGHLILGPLVGVLIAWLATRVVVKVRIGRRCARFADRLPDALQLISGSLKSGFSLGQALDALVQQGLPVLSAEIGRAVAEARIGVPIEDALTKVADRMESQDLHWTVMTIRIQREVGGNLAEVLTTTAETMRERARVRGHVRALSAEGRLSAYVLIALPIGVAAFMLLARAAYLRPLYTEPLGIFMLVVAAVLTVVGWFWMVKLSKVEV
jgi:tight adherence protein B